MFFDDRHGLRDRDQPLEKAGDDDEDGQVRDRLSRFKMSREGNADDPYDVEEDWSSTRDEIPFLTLEQARVDAEETDEQ